MTEHIDVPLEEPIQGTLRKITERLAAELANPAESAPDWSPTEWRVARAVAAIHCISPLLADSLRWQGPASWQIFLAAQKAHVTARHHRLEALLSQIDDAAREAEIPVVGLKGAALHAMGLYRAGQRPMADIDLLVQPSDEARTSSALKSLGFNESFRSWKHGIWVPEICEIHARFGEHADNHLKVELHTRIAEKLPLRIWDVTDSVYPQKTRPGLISYSTHAALLTHLLIHAAGAMAYRSLKLLNLHDIALVSSQMTQADWEELLAPRKWWAFPPLQLTARYYPHVIPPDVLAMLAKQCPWTLRHKARRRHVTDTSLSYPWIEAFPGIGWSRSLTEVIEYVGGRVLPGKESRRQRRLRVETDYVASETQWCQLSQRQRLLRWLTSSPLRVETLHAVRMALALAP